MHETHKVIGRHASAFEDPYRDEWVARWPRATTPVSCGT